MKDATPRAIKLLFYVCERVGYDDVIKALVDSNNPNGDKEWRTLLRRPCKALFDQYVEAELIPRYRQEVEGHSIAINLPHDHNNMSDEQKREYFNEGRKKYLECSLADFRTRQSMTHARFISLPDLQALLKAIEPDLLTESVRHWLYGVDVESAIISDTKNLKPHHVYFDDIQAMVDRKESKIDACRNAIKKHHPAWTFEQIEIKAQILRVSYDKWVRDSR